MSKQLSKKISVALSLITIVMSAHAQKNSIPCPSISLIQTASLKVDTAVKFSGVYSVYTSTDAFVENEISWIVGTNNLAAASRDEAIVKGKEIILNTTLKNQEEATVINPGEYSCTYGPGNIYALGFKR
jgi:hypothetical protein